MGLPFTLKNWNVFNEAQSFLGVAEEIETPKLKVKTEEYRGAGMLGGVDLDMGLEKLEATVTYGGLVLPVLRQMGTVGISGIMLRFVGGFQDDSVGAVMQGEMVMRGRHTEIDRGTFKGGDPSKTKVMSSLTYYRELVNGSEVIEIDMINGVYRVNGVDRYAEIRDAIGF